MGLAAVVLVGALAVGRLSGGTLAGLATLRPRRPVLVLTAAAAQLLGAVLVMRGATTGGYLAGLVASGGLVALFLAANRHLPGAGLFSLGLLANAAVVAANGAMPVSLAAAARAGVDTRAIAAAADPRHTVAGRGTWARGLGDVVPVPLPLRPAVASPGDVLVAAGLAELVVVGMRSRRGAGDAPAPAAV